MRESEPGRTADDEAIWLYDGLCGFCSWSVRFVLANERAPSSKFVAIQSSLGRQLAIEHAINPDEPSTFLFLDRGRAYQKSDGLIALARHLRWPWRALGGLRAIPRSVRDRLYDVLARNRFRILGRKQSCDLPSSAVRARFILPD